jgi:hippurate hydrolase
MLDDGLFTRFKKPDFAFALHSGGAPYGYVNYRAGVGSSNVDGLYIRFRGRGGHGAMPQMTIDPVMIAARFIVDVQTVISREKDPTEFAVVTIGAIHSGTVGNIIPDEATLQGTIRTFKPAVRAKLVAGIERVAKAAAEMSDAPAPEIRIAEGTKAVINDPAVVATAEKALKAAFGDKLRQTPANTTSEDFSEFAGAGVPSMMFNIGVYEPERWTAANDSGTPLAKPTIQTGITAMTLAVLSAFDQYATGK